MCAKYVQSVQETILHLYSQYFTQQTGFVYTCMQNQFCIHFIYEKFSFGTIRQSDTQTDRHTDICTSRAASSQLKTKIKKNPF